MVKVTDRNLTVCFSPLGKKPFEESVKETGAVEGTKSNNSVISKDIKIQI